jgi:hypothetical protein
MLYFEFGEGITARSQYDDHADAIRVDFRGLSRHLSFHVVESTEYDESEEFYDLCDQIYRQADARLCHFIREHKAAGVGYLGNDDVDADED